MKMNKNYFKQCIVYLFLRHKDENRFSNWIVLIGIRQKKVDCLIYISDTKSGNVLFLNLKQNGGKFRDILSLGAGSGNSFHLSV